MKNTIFTIRIYRGQPAYDATGKLISENQTMKLEHNSIQYDRFIQSARNVGYIQIDVLKATIDGVDVPVDAAIKEQIEGCVKAPEKKITPEQQELKELRAMLAELKAGKSEKVEGSSNEDLEKARQEYLELFNKKPHHKTTLETLRAEIDAKLAE